MDIPCWLPRVVFIAKPLPLDKVLQFTMPNPTVEDPLNFPLLRVIYQNRGRWRYRVPPLDRILRSRSELYNWEDRVKTSHG